MSDPPLFDDPLSGSPGLRKLIDRRQQIAEHILSGRIDDWAEYRHQLGLFISFGETVSILTEKPEQPKRGDDDAANG